MNRYYLLLALIYLSFNVNAQSPLQLDSDTIYIAADVAEVDKLLPIAYVKNVSTDTVRFLWKRNIIDMPQAWEAAVCDQTSCYAPIVAVCPDDSPNILAPGDTTSFYVQVKHNEAVGVGVIQLTAFPVGFPDSILVTGTYDYSVLMTGTRDIINLQSKVFPNPAGDYFRLELEETNAELQIISNTGQIVKRFTSLSTNAIYDIQDLPKGHYWIQLIREDLQRVRAVALVKH